MRGEWCTGAVDGTVEAAGGSGSDQEGQDRHFRGSWDERGHEEDGVDMEAEVEPTPKRTGNKRERSLSAGSIVRTSELAIAGGGGPRYHRGG